MYEHVCYRKKEVRARLLSWLYEKMYEHVYYRKKDVRARLLS